jgi:hypothetical protein
VSYYTRRLAKRILASWEFKHKKWVNKKSHTTQLCGFFRPFKVKWQDVCAQDWTRTSMPFRAPPPQGGASTNFATWAGGAADKGSRLSEDNPDFNKNL